ncbi:hypothetical protein BKA83DRAFT_9978 [Pisolithus microcarpus]|nr:hypothetical protein BKA83DRAFT_9978 [Pisolithus microcarpus]
MSASSLFESYDTQMIDFPHDLDVPMNPSSSELHSMDHDPGDGSIEVDMEEYGENHSEYEMADGTEFLVAGESLDVEVFDVSRAHSPLPAFEQPSLHSTVDASIGSDPYHSAAHDIPKRLADSTAPPVDEYSGDVPLEHGAYDVPRSEPLPSQDTSSVPQLNPDRDEEFHGKSNSDIPSNRGPDLPQVSGEPDPGHGVLPTEAPVPLSEGYRTPLHSKVVAEGDHNEPLGQEEGHDPPNTDFPFEHAEPASQSAGVYIDPPPAVLLSVGSSAEALFCLFNQPTAEESPPHEGREGPVGGYHLLLESSPTLYYEPISNMRSFCPPVPHSFEGELVFDDNIYAREYSLHDLNVLYDGSDFAGPLRLRLTATIPRFIYQQIQRLDLAVGASGDKQHDDQAYTRASEQQQSHGDQTREQATTLPTDGAGDATDRPTVVSGGTDGQQEDPPSSEEAADPFIPQSAEDVDYHAVPTGEAQVLEEEDDYENTNRGVGDTTTEGVLDADQLHGSADTDQATSSSGDMRFGGEQTDYHVYLLPEEYDEREGEDLDKAEAGSQFDESVQHEVEEDAAGAGDVTASVHEVEATSDSKEVTLKAFRRSSLSESSPKELSNLKESQILPSAADDRLLTGTEEHHGNDGPSHRERGESTTPSRSQSAATEQGPQNGLYPDEHNYRAWYVTLWSQPSEGNSGQVAQDDGDDWGWDDADGEDDIEYWPEHDAISDNSTATLVQQRLLASPGTPETKRTRVE